MQVNKCKRTTCLSRICFLSPLSIVPLPPFVQLGTVVQVTVIHRNRRWDPDGDDDDDNDYFDDNDDDNDQQNYYLILCLSRIAEIS